VSDIATLLMSEFVTHDVKRFILEKPADFKFAPGQGALVAINQPGLREDGHPFTPTSLADDKVLEFTIKGYPEHHGLTEKLHALQPGAELVLGDVFGTIQYQGPGVFIAGGAGITPFIAIFRQLAREGKLAGHSLIFSNKTRDDVILEREFRHYLGDRCLFTLTRESAPGYEKRRIDAKFLKEKIHDFGQAFYVCGPPSFVEGITQLLQTFGAKADSVVFEQG
jgi:cytochrome-b5 reductase